MTTSPSFREILSDLRNDKVRRERRTDWAIAYLYRPPGTALSWVFLRMGMGPVAVSVLGLIVSLFVPAFALWLPVWLAAWMVCFCGVAFQILDCSDGTVARMTGRTSILGADLDYFFGMVHYLCLYPSIGLLADRTFESGLLWTAVATIAVAVRFLARLIRDQIALRKSQGEDTPFRLNDIPVAFLAGLTGLIPFGALSGPYLGAVVVALLIYSVLDVIDASLPLRDAPYRPDS
ncbi:CDP-alcohol phosphatidyltransferase [Shimia gijangensis]|uniref:CDP-alcohol phosphatidyltransferase n=1 Tax=Shimia gijangensis TaxID=1470563 RepID=A0A1M6BML4_9RHOB|nr:CDP-alcohol phosphatidyltransferase family protein [Shimia gijangensis]SHI49788.1 CDP-alcohol phosphatidyltransferase [Shimia gijangensis]